MKAWLIYGRESAEYNSRYIEFYKEEGIKLGIDIKLILVEETEFGVNSEGYYIRINGQREENPDFAICRVIYPLLSRHFEYMGIPVFNNSKVSEICNDKAKTCQYLAGIGIPMVESAFYSNSRIPEILDRITERKVIKAVDGHGGSQVFLTQSESIGADSSSKEEQSESDVYTETVSKEEIIRGLGSSDVVVQPLTGSKHQDLRVYVIGKEIIAGVLRTAEKGFKSNYSLGGSVSLFTLKEEQARLVQRIIDEFEFGFVGIDFLIGDEGELIFNEIEDVVGSRMLYQCSDINIVERYLKYILEQLRKADACLEKGEVNKS